jgi:metal-responsive CopG/Arc/MetJ family transcriptional regulator
MEAPMRLQVDIPEDLKTQTKIRALKEGITLSELVEAALRAYLETLEKQGK